MDPRFFQKREFVSGTELLEVLGAASLIGDRAQKAAAKMRFNSIQPLDRATVDDLSFFHNAKYLNDLEASAAGLILVPHDLMESVPASSKFLAVTDVHQALALVGQAFLIKPPIVPGIHDSASISPDALVDPGAQIGPFVSIGPGAEIGAGTVIGPSVSLNQGVKIGSDCRIDANVSLSHALIGDRVHIKPGAAIGQRGFGWALSPTGHTAKPQVGRVLIGNDVEIGSNCAIDRGSVEDTIIGDGTVIDNLCHIGHNCKIGRYCVLAATIAFAGSTTLGDFVIMGGGVAAKGHVHIADGTFAKAWTFIGRNTKPGEVLVGNPARSSTAYQRLLRNWSRIARGAKDT